MSLFFHKNSALEIYSVHVPASDLNPVIRKSMVLQYRET